LSVFFFSHCPCEATAVRFVFPDQALSFGFSFSLLVLHLSVGADFLPLYSFLRAGAQDPSVEVQFSCKDHRSRCQFGSLAEFLRFWSHSCRLGFPLGFFALRALEFMPHASRSAPPEIVSPTRFSPAGLRSACFLPVALILL
jgi:hypothetical protein